MKFAPVTVAALILPVMFHVPIATAQTATPANNPAPANTPAPVAQAPAAAATPDLDSVITDLQRITVDANRDLSALHIEKWKSDPVQKQQMQQAAGSLRRNLSTIIPGPAKEL